MYQIDKENNDLIKLEPRQFADLGFRERDHLQEWIAKNPEVLGEELLIIQKEYAGFNDTKERLDLLAIDKDGGLVVVENKLDDTGRDVTWQALKYTSYCSTLTTAQIVKLFQEFLDQRTSKEDAKEVLLDFLEIEDENELLLNDRDQRIIFVANNYRKEVTSTVLWLLDHDIHVQCFRAMPYSKGEDVFLQIEQIIPLPETQEFMIDAKEKEREDKGKSKVVAEGKARLVEFWGVLKKELEQRNFDLLSRVTPKGYYNIGSLVGSGRFAFCIGRYGMRVELYFGNDKDKKLFDSMYERKVQLESSFGKEITWERLENKNASRIKHEIKYKDLALDQQSFSDKKVWDSWVNWYADSMIDFYRAALPVWKEVSK
jgi:hypothetical protein